MHLKYVLIFAPHFEYFKIFYLNTFKYFYQFFYFLHIIIPVFLTISLLFPRKKSYLLERFPPTFNPKFISNLDVLSPSYRSTLRVQSHPMILVNNYRAPEKSIITNVTKYN